MQTTKSSILAKAALALGLGHLDKTAPTMRVDPEFSLSWKARHRSRTHGPRRPAGSKLARKVAKGRLYNAIQ